MSDYDLVVIHPRYTILLTKLEENKNMEFSVQFILIALAPVFIITLGIMQ